jgi:hypothetical protein
MLKVSIANTMRGLEELCPERDEKLDLFNHRFRKYLELVPAKLYTPDSLKVAYNAAMSSVKFRNLMWSLNTHPKYCMIFVEKLRATQLSLHETSNPKDMDTSDSNARRFGTEPVE